MWQLCWTALNITFSNLQAMIEYMYAVLLFIIVLNYIFIFLCLVVCKCVTCSCRPPLDFAFQVFRCTLYSLCWRGNYVSVHLKHTCTCSAVVLCFRQWFFLPLCPASLMYKNLQRCKIIILWRSMCPIGCKECWLLFKDAYTYLL